MPDRIKMSALNRVYVYLECLLRRQGQNANSCDWLELEEVPDLETLRLAARYVANRHPAIQAASSFGGRKGYSWVRNPHAFPKIILEERDEFCPTAPDERLSNNIWGEPLDHEAGPPWRLHVTRFNDKCLLQSITSHVYTCGKSANLVTSDLLDAYAAITRGETLSDEVIDVPNRNANALFAPGWSPWKRSVLAVSNAVSMLGEAIQVPVGLATNRTSPVSRAKTRVAFVEYGSEFWNHLRDFARTEGISRHPFYLGAWAEALLGFNEAHGKKYRGSVKIMDNFSLRPFSGQDLTNFYDLCAPPYAINIPCRQSNPGLRRGLYERLQDLKNGKILNELARFNMYGAVVAVLGKTWASKLVVSTIAKSPFIVSNTGKIPPGITRPHPLGVTRYFSFPQLFPPGKIMLVISATDTDLRVVFLWDEDAISERAMTENLVPRFRAALERATGFDEARASVATAAE